MIGFVKIHRKLKEWEWYNKSEMVHLFMHLILSANNSDGSWQGREVKRGQLITGLHSLNKATGISIQTLRTCLKRLQNSHEINIQSTKLNSLITICKYDDYNDKYQQANKQSTNDQQTSNKRSTTNKNDKEYKEDIYMSILNSFKAITGKGAKVIPDKVKTQIEKRIEEGYTIEDINTAIKNCSQDSYHIENPKYLTIEFITRQDKLEQWLHVKPKKQVEQQSLFVPA